MVRPYKEFVFSQNIEWTLENPLPGRKGTETKLLSLDSETGEMSVILRVPAGWQYAAASGFQEEIYVLDGCLKIGEAQFARDGYFRVPAGSSAAWTSERGATALVFLNAATPTDDGALSAIDTTRMVWDRSGVPPELDFMGIARKALFVDRDTGRHRTWLLSTLPQIAPDGSALAVETHSCDEEVFILGGDIVGPHGAMTVGAYFWRPRDTVHGPFGSRNGGLAISRFRNGEQKTFFHNSGRVFDFDAPYRPIVPAALSLECSDVPASEARY
jgi:hypothetical protein